MNLDLINIHSQTFMDDDYDDPDSGDSDSDTEEQTIYGILVNFVG